MTKQERQARYRERLRLRLSSPSAVALAASEVPDDLLDPFTRAVRDRLHGYLEDLGGADALADTKVAQVRSLVEADLVLEPMTRDVLMLARAGQLWSLRTRRAAALLQDWLRLKAHRDALLVAVGLTRAAARVKSLEEITREVLAEDAAEQAAQAGEAPVSGHVATGAEEASAGPTDPSEGAKPPRGPERGDGTRAIPGAEQAHPASRPRQAEPTEPLMLTVPSLTPSRQPEQAAAPRVARVLR